MAALCLAFGPIPWSAGAEPVSEEPLEAPLLKNVKALTAKLWEAGATNLGVLPFEVRHEGQSEFPSSVGRLNFRLAEKTQLALCFSTPKSDGTAEREFGVIRNAGEVIAAIPGASHRKWNDAAARERLFTRDYPLAWKKRDGSAVANPDAFLSGVAEISKDLGHITVQLYTFVRKGVTPGLPEGLAWGEAFRTPIGLDTLIASGEGYCLPFSPERMGGETREEAIVSARRSRDNPKKEHPFQSPSRPVDLEIYYNGVKQYIEFYDAKDDPNKLGSGARVRDPLPGQKVVFIVRRKNSADKKRYGILLRINGENTLLRERAPDSKCTLWIMEANMHAVVVDGFHHKIGEKGSQEKFEVLEAKESLERENYYRQDVGLIALSVYEEETAPAEADSIRKPVTHTISNSTLPGETAENREKYIMKFPGLADFLHPDRQGVIGWRPGPNPAPTKIVEFQRGPEPMFSGSVRYYRPRTIPTN